MKRKLFTLLLAIVALGTFQAKAQQPGSWVLADTSGLKNNTNLLQADSFPLNKLGLYNWFSVNGSGIYVHSRNDINDPAEIYADDKNNKFTFVDVQGNNKRFKISSDKKNVGDLTLSWGGNDQSQFEVVQFPGNLRTAQSFSDDSIEGYLVLPQGAGDADSAYSKEFVFVTVDKQGKLELKKFSDLFGFSAYIPKSPVLGIQHNDIAKKAGRLYSTLNMPYFQLYGRNYDNTADTLVIGTSPVDTAYNWATNASSSPAVVYTYYDGKFDGNKITIGDSTITMDSLIHYIYEGNAGSSPSLTSPCSDIKSIIDTIDVTRIGLTSVLISDTEDKIFIQNNGGSLSFTAPLKRSADTIWSNGVPTEFTIASRKVYFSIDISDVNCVTEALFKIYEEAFNFSNDTLTNNDSLYWYAKNDDVRPLYIKVIPGCSPNAYEYVTVDDLKENLLDISAAIQNIAGVSTAFVDNGDAGGYAGVTDRTDIRAEFLIEFSDSISATTHKTKQSMMGQLFDNTIPVQLFTIKNGNKYLTVSDTTIFFNVQTIDSTITNTQLIWTAEEFTGDSIARQQFAIVHDRDSNLYTLLPVASYKWQSTPSKPNYYKKETDTLYINKALGVEKADKCGVNFVNISKAWYITQLSKVGQSQKLIIADPSSAQTSNEIIWFNLEHSFNAGKIPCTGTFAIYKVDKDGKQLGYYTSEGLKADTAAVVKPGMLGSLWTSKTKNKGNNEGVVFIPELDMKYANPIVGNILLNNSGSADSVFIISNAGNGIFEIITDTSTNAFEPYFRAYVKIECVEVKAPFQRIDEFTGSHETAILEALYRDRNISYYTSNINETKSEAFGKDYESSIRKVTVDSISSYSWVYVYKSIERTLGESKTYEVPYYSFAWAKDSNTDSLYFLSAVSGDSVRWVKLDSLDQVKLLNPDTYDDPDSKLANSIFCLPFKNGINEDEGVYLQTLDGTQNRYTIPANTNYFGLVKSGSITGSVDFEQFPAPLLGYASSNYNSQNGIFDVIDVYGNATEIKDISSWVFVSKSVVKNDWVRIDAVVDASDSTKAGVLSNVDIAAGLIYLTPVNPVPANTATYGILNTLTADNLTLKFVGEQTVGYNNTPIWYYNIILNADSSYLTDAFVKYNGGNDPYYTYTYAVSGGTPNSAAKFAYAYFDKTALPLYSDYVSAGVYADKGFNQAFGLKYVDKDAQHFVIVSGVDYTTNSGVVYRYLGRAGNRLVFVQKLDDALLFQWGKIDGGSYTDIEEVAVSGAKVYGVAGGVKVAGATGSVSIYAIDGRLVTTTAIVSADQTIAVPAGIYIVKVGSNVTKVVVR